MIRLWNPPWFQPECFLVESLHLIRAYYVAAELGIADLLDEQPRDISQLAQATGSARALVIPDAADLGCVWRLFAGS